VGDWGDDGGGGGTEVDSAGEDGTARSEIGEKSQVVSFYCGKSMS
jgi:hypothetical protein